MSYEPYPNQPPDQGWQQQPPPGGYQPPPGYQPYPGQPTGATPGWGGGPGWSGPQLAGWWYRVGATIIDGIICAIIPVIIQVAISRALGDTLNVLVNLLYVVLLLGRPDARTVGMMAVSTRCVDAASGGPIGYGRSFLRWLVTLVLGITIIGGILDILWPLWDKQNQTLHDKAAHSLVIMNYR